jgi:photosystem II stability/assembly factor-like uncharacterized protein
MKIKTIKIFLATISLATSLVCAANANQLSPDFWQSLHGPYGGYVSSFLPVTIDTSQHKIFAATLFGLFVSSDHGEHWSCSLPTYQINALTADVEHTIYVGTEEHGIFVSKDFGKNWLRPVSPSFLQYATVNALKVDQKNKIYAATANGIYFSSDSGVHWQRPAKDDPTLNKKILALARDNDDAIYALSLVAGKQEIYKSTNAGLNWHSLNLSKHDFYSNTKFVFDAKNNLYLGGTGDAIYFYNAGIGKEPWTSLQFSGQDGNSNLAFADNNVFAGFYSGDLFSCSSNCQELTAWQKLTGVQHTVFDLFLEKYKGLTTFCVATDNGIYFSQDQTRSWQEAIQPVAKQIVNSFAEDEKNILAGLTVDGVLIAAHGQANIWHLPQQNITAIKVMTKPLLDNNHVYLPSDNGLYSADLTTGNWQLNADYTMVTNLLAEQSGTIFINNNFSLFLSNDHGKSWQLGLSSPVFYLISYQNHTYAITEDEKGDRKILVTADHGKTWNDMGNPEQRFRTSFLALTSNNNLIAAGFSLQKNATQVFHTDAQKNKQWHLLCQSGSDEILQQLLVDAQNNSFYVVTSFLDKQAMNNINKMYFYNGESCQLTSAQHLGKIVVDSNTGYLFQYHYSRQNTGLLISMDHGVNWSALPLFANQDITDLIVDTERGWIFLSTLNSGVYVSINHGSTWRELNTGLTSLAIQYLAFDNLNYLYTQVVGGVMYRSWLPILDVKP